MTTDNLQDYLNKRGVTDEQMDEARRKTQELLEGGVRQTDSDVAIELLAEHIGRKLNEIREAEHAEERDREREDALWGELNALLLVRHKVYMGNEEAGREILGLEKIDENGMPVA